MLPSNGFRLRTRLAFRFDLRSSTFVDAPYLFAPSLLGDPGDITLVIVDPSKPHKLVASKVSSRSLDFFFWYIVSWFALGTDP